MAEAADVLVVGAGLAGLTAARACQQHSFGAELQRDVAPAGPNGAPHADLIAPLKHRYHHHVADTDPPN